MSPVLHVLARKRLFVALACMLLVSAGCGKEPSQATDAGGAVDATSGSLDPATFVGTWQYVVGNVDYVCSSMRSTRQPDALTYTIAQRSDGSFVRTEAPGGCAVSFDLRGGGLVARADQSCAVTAGAVTITDRFTTLALELDVARGQLREVRTGTLGYSTGESCSYTFNAVTYRRQ